MENILDALKAMKKATARDVAARLQIEPQAALDMLREHEDRFEAVQSNGYWWPTKTDDVPQKAAPQKAVPPVRITPFDLKGLLVEKGPLQADQLAKITGATAKGVATMLTNLVTKGEVSREKVGNKFVYSVPVATAAAATVDSVPETAAPPVTVDIAKEMAAKTTAGQPGKAAGYRTGAAPPQKPAGRSARCINYLAALTAVCSHQSLSAVAVLTGALRRFVVQTDARGVARGFPARRAARRLPGRI